MTKSIFIWRNGDKHGRHVGTYTPWIITCMMRIRDVGYSTMLVMLTGGCSMGVRDDSQQCDTNLQMPTKRSLVIILRPSGVGVDGRRLSTCVLGDSGMIGYRQRGEYNGRLGDITRLHRGYLLFAKNPSGRGGCQPQVQRLDDGVQPRAEQWPSKWPA